MLHYLLIKPKKIFECFICFWKWFYTFVLLVFVQNAFLCFSSIDWFRGSFARSSKSWASCETASEPSFDEKHKNAFWTKTRNMKVQNHFQKHIKHSKIFLGLINKYLSIHITFEHVQSHKWDKHYLNKVLCVVCEYQMWNSL